MMTTTKKGTLLAGCVLLILAVGRVQAQTRPPAPTEPEAQTAAPTQPEAGNEVSEIVVTAQKRAENVQDVPLSIVAQSGAQLQKAGIDNPVQLRQIVPDLKIVPIAQAAGVVLAIRGFGSASNAAIDPDVAPYIDGSFIPRPGAALTDFLDINNVEVLRGPQGTLFGRNSTVGAISITTNAPSLSGRTAYVSAEGANYGTYQFQGVGNLPVTETFALRGALLAAGTDGYVDNAFDGRTYGADSRFLVRGSALWNITPDLTWTVRVDDARQTGDGVNYNAIDTATASPAQIAAYQRRLGSAGAVLSDPPSFNANQRFDVNLTDSQWGVSSDLTWKLAGGYTLRLLDSFRDWHNSQSDGDVIYTTLDLLNRDVKFSSNSQSHELQLNSPTSLLGGRFSFVTGLYYFREDYGIFTTYDIGSQYCSFIIAAAAPALLRACSAGPAQGALQNEFMQREESFAGYFQGDYELTDALTLTLGVRDTSDAKSGRFTTVTPNPAIALLGAAENEPTLHYDNTQPTYRANLSWKVTPQVLTFFSYSTGYKSGGFSSAIATPALTTATRTFQAETSRDYELGLKSTFFSRRLLINADLFQTEISNFQDRAFNGLAFVVRNSGDIRARGIEGEGQVVLRPDLTLSFGADYLDSIYSSFPNAPGLPGCTGAANSCPTTQNLTGRRNTNAPPYQANMALQYDTPRFWGGYRVTIRPDVSYEDAFYSTNDLNPQGIIKSHFLDDLRVSINSADNRYTLTAFAENLTDLRYFIGKFPQALDSLLGVRVPATGATLYRAYLGPPVSVGAKLEARF